MLRRRQRLAGQHRGERIKIEDAAAGIIELVDDQAFGVRLKLLNDALKLRKRSLHIWRLAGASGIGSDADIPELLAFSVLIEVSLEVLGRKVLNDGTEFGQ